MGPILFIIYVNYLPEVVQSNLLMFADDTKIYCTISFNEDSILLHWPAQYYEVLLTVVNEFKL